MNKLYKIFPLADAAAAIELGNTISEDINRKILAMRDWLLNHPFDGLRDIIVAYGSLTVYYDPIRLRKSDPLSEPVFAFVYKKLEQSFNESAARLVEENKTIRIPVCYDNGFGTDIDFVCSQKNISREEMIRVHKSKTYRVYMIGFLPGFSYLGKIEEALIIPRKPKPVNVLSGSVGIAGSQTGIYPLNCLGGWQIIGRTPMRMFDPNLSAPVLLNVGDWVEFYEIGKEEFDNWDSGKG